MGTPTLICAAGHTVRGERGRVHTANQEILNKNLAIANVEFYLYLTVGTVLIHSVKPELTE